MPLSFLSPLHKASRQLTMHLEARTRALGVSPTEGHLLTYLGRYAPAPVGELVRVFGTKQSTLTSILDRLEGAELLRRLPNPDDRRSVLLRLTPKGRTLAGRLNRELVALEREIGARVSERDRAGFSAVMAAVGAVTGVKVR
jgi:DNA-binding MarR family transcriptional regulator